MVFALHGLFLHGFVFLFHWLKLADSLCTEKLWQHLYARVLRVFAGR